MLGFRKIGGCTFLGVPIVRIVVFWALYWGPPIYENYQISSARLRRREYGFRDFGFRVSGLGREEGLGGRDRG